MAENDASFTRLSTSITSMLLMATD